MRQTQAKIAVVTLQVLLHLALGVTFLAAVYTRFYSGLLPVTDLPNWPAYLAYFVVSFTLWSVLETKFAIIHNCIGAPSLLRWTWVLVRLNLLTLALVSGAAFFWRGYSFSRVTVAGFWGLHVVLCVAAAAGVRAWWRRRRDPAGVCLFLIGEELPLDLLRKECLPPEAEVRVRRYPEAGAALAALQALELPAGCGEVLVALPASAAGDLEILTAALERLAVPASLALASPAEARVHATPSFIVLTAGPAAAGAFDYVFSKRLVDIALSAAALLVLSPVLIWITLRIWRHSGRPILLSQERVGRGGRRFPLLKFRTLPAESLRASDQQWSAAPTDPGSRFLRDTGLDELPQLWNVLRGDMSLVGPRPERPYFVEQFRRQLPFYSTRHRLQVGLTGWAQVNGWRGDTSIARRVEHDLYYLRHWSLAFDFRILWRTLTDFVRRLRGGAAERAPDAGTI